MGRTASATDRNHQEIAEALRKAGATVSSLHAVGMGIPDLLVGYQGRNHLLEVKDGSLPPSKQKLTPMQIRWHESWRGNSVVVNSVEAAMAAVGMIPVSGAVVDDGRIVR